MLLTISKAPGVAAAAGDSVVEDEEIERRTRKTTIANHSGPQQHARACGRGPSLALRHSSHVDFLEDVSRGK